jgi:hypothetical protein
MVNSLTLMSPERGEISFLKEFPIWAAAKGRRPYKERCIVNGAHRPTAEKPMVGRK